MLVFHSRLMSLLGINLLSYHVCVLMWSHTSELFDIFSLLYVMRQVSYTVFLCDDRCTIFTASIHVHPNLFII